MKNSKNFLLVGIIVVLSGFLAHTSIFYFNNRPSDFNTAHIDSAVAIYRYIQPYKYFNDTICPNIVFSEDVLDNVTFYEDEKYVSRVVKYTLRSLSIIDWVVEEEFFTDTKNDTLVLTVNYTFVEINNLLSLANKYNEEIQSTFLMPDPSHAYFHVVVQNNVIFQYLMFNPLPLKVTSLELLFTIKDRRLRLEKIVTI